MARGPAANLPGAEYFDELSPARLLGISPANQTKAAGHALPPTTATGGDMVANWWHPDSPTFWLVAVAGGTLLGVIGASVEVRGRAFRGRGRAGAEIGTT